MINGIKRQRTLTAKEDSRLLILPINKYNEISENDSQLALMLSRICMVR